MFTGFCLERISFKWDLKLDEIKFYFLYLHPYFIAGVAAYVFKGRKFNYFSV